MPAENQMNGKLSYTSATGTCFIKHFDFRTNSDSLVLHSLSLRLWPLTSRIHSKTLFIPAISWKVHLKPFVRFSMPEALALQGRRAPVRPGDRQGDTARSPPNRTSSLLTPWSCSYSVEPSSSRPWFCTQGWHLVANPSALSLSGAAAEPLPQQAKGTVCSALLHRVAAAGTEFLVEKNILSPSSHKYFIPDYTQVLLNE